MKIQLLFFSRLREMLGQDSRWIELSEESTIRDAIRVVFREKLDEPITASLLYAVNESFEDEDTILKERDVLALMTPVAGG